MRYSTNEKNQPSPSSDSNPPINLSLADRQEILYEGKAKIIYKTGHQGILMQYFKDDITAGNGAKQSYIDGKGRLNSIISAKIMGGISRLNIAPTHFIGIIDDNYHIIKEVDIIPLEVIIRNRVAGSFAKRYGLAEGTELAQPIIEFCLKDDALSDPEIAETAIIQLGILNNQELAQLKQYAKDINIFLKGLFFSASTELIDFKIEFGRRKAPSRDDSTIILADEISPDSCRIWDIETKEKLDKDVFRRDLGDVKTIYQKLAKRLNCNI